MKTFANYLPNWFKLLVVSSLAIVTYGIGHLGDSSDLGAMPANDAQPMAHEIQETLWLDRVPEMMHDSWQGYIFTTDNVGLSVQAESSFKLTLEIFEFQLRKDSIRWHFPHDGKKAETKYSIERLKKPTKHFDRQLTIQNDPKNGGETKVYFTGPEFASGAGGMERLLPSASSTLSNYTPAGLGF